MESVFEKKECTRAVLVSVRTDGTEDEYEASLAELGRLLETAGGEVYAEVVQNREYPDKRTYVGSGKLEEIKELCISGNADLVVFDGELTPSQIRNCEGELDDVRVIDRPMLILDIFALHAATGEGKLQVELAQLKYTLPRLTGKGKEMSRLGGGIGTRGPGESKLQTDRRHVMHRIEALESQARELEKNRMTQRAQRDRSGLFRFAVAGYTNAGKSTLTNALTGAGILAEDKLFATLDPTTRKYTLPDGTDILLTDTVGFIRNLPTQLIKAFRSTLDEVVFSDGIIVVADASDPEIERQLDVTEDLIAELGAGGKPVLYVFNKCDKCEVMPRHLCVKDRDAVFISALTGEGMEQLQSALSRIANGNNTREILTMPQTAGAAVAYLYKNATVHSCEYGENITVDVTLDKKTRGTVMKMLGDVK